GRAYPDALLVHRHRHCLVLRYPYLGWVVPRDHAAQTGRERKSRPFHEGGGIYEALSHRTKCFRHVARGRPCGVCCPVRSQRAPLWSSSSRGDALARSAGPRGTRVGYGRNRVIGETIMLSMQRGPSIFLGITFTFATGWIGSILFPHI